MLGIILCGFILSFFVPSTTARVACLVPIVTGMVRAFGLPLKSAFGAMLLITVAQVDSVWNVGIKTAAAQNMVAVGFIQELTGHDISWLDWFVAAAPFAALMSVVLYVVVTRLFKGSLEDISGGDDAVRRELAKLGPMSAAEWKLTVVSLVLLFMWVTEKKLHPFDTTTTTVCAIALLMLPSMGVMDWKSVVNRINWGTLLVFGVGISLGSTLLSTHAAQWLLLRARRSDHFCRRCGSRPLSHHHSPRLCIRRCALKRSHPNHHRSRERTRCAERQCAGHYDDSAVRHQLRLHSSGQCSAESDCLLNRCI